MLGPALSALLWATASPAKAKKQKAEINKITARHDADGDPAFLQESLKLFLDELRRVFGAEDTKNKGQQKNSNIISLRKKIPPYQGIPPRPIKMRTVPRLVPVTR